MKDVGQDSRSATSEPYPLKRFGQHFLRDPRVIKRIVEALDPQPDQTIIEIGPGTGALTADLLERSARVVAIEFDKNLAPFLQERFQSAQNFSLIRDDALEVDFCASILPSTKARVVANLPYNISTAILQRLIARRGCLTDMVLMLQKEVVDRILAPAGSSDRGYLSAFVEAYCESEKLFDVGPGAFKPPPKVWSSVVHLRFREHLKFSVKSEELLWETVSAGFAQKRKTILNNLRNSTGRLQEVVKRNGGASIILCKAGVDVQRRAETITLEEWGTIVQEME